MKIFSLALTLVLFVLLSGCSSSPKEVTEADHLTPEEKNNLVNNARNFILNSKTLTLSPAEVNTVRKANAILSPIELQTMAKPNVELIDKDKLILKSARTKLTEQEYLTLLKARSVLQPRDLIVIKNTPPSLNIAYNGHKTGKAIITWRFTERVKLLPSSKALTEIERKRIIAIAQGKLLESSREWSVKIMNTGKALFIDKKPKFRNRKKTSRKRK